MNYIMNTRQTRKNIFTLLLYLGRSLTEILAKKNYSLWTFTVSVKLEAGNRRLLIQSLEWLFHNFSKIHHFIDHVKDN